MYPRAIELRPWGHVSLLGGLALVVSNCTFSGGAERWDDDLSTVGLVVREELVVVPLSAEVTLTDLLAIALDRRADLEVAESEVAAAWGRARQAGLWPNPELEFEAEELGSDVSDAEEYTVTLTQPIVLGGRLRAARQAGLREHRAAMWGLAGLHREVAGDVSAAHFRYIGAEAKAALAQDQLETAQRLTMFSQARRETGRGTGLETVRAEVELADAELELMVASREIATARDFLARTVGLNPAELPTVAGGLSSPPALPPDHRLLNWIYDGHPLVEQRRAEIEQSEWALRQSRRERIPDIALGFGPRYFADSDADDSFVATVGMTIPLFDRNQGAIAAADANLTAAKAALVATTQDLLSELGETYGRYEVALVHLERLDTEIIPSAARAQAMALEGFRIGTFTQLVVLEARATLNKLQGRRIEALVELLTAHSAVSTLMGLDPSSTKTEEIGQ